ncbi:rCG62091 [Rattus norvegicus]|uniref:RCG62091 n=1 Tax=Rattus norvegicus TaxID=10116 RepID=A6HAB9_RAT|nr:rCG62091 [Rattus norvegicus]
MVLVSAHILNYNLSYHRERFLFQKRAKEGPEEVKPLTRL